MKIKVNYSIVVKKEIEVDDKFKGILTTDNYAEEDQLVDELLGTVSEELEEYNDIYSIADADTNEMLYEY